MAGGANWFIALPVTAEALPADVIDGLPAGLRRLHPDDLHVTVAFLGPVGEDCALTAWAETEDIDAGPFELRTGAPAALGRPRRPSAYGLDLVADRSFIDWVAYWRDRGRGRDRARDALDTSARYPGAAAAHRRTEHPAPGADLAGEHEARSHHAPARPHRAIHGLRRQRAPALPLGTAADAAGLRQLRSLTQSPAACRMAPAGSPSHSAWKWCTGPCPVPFVSASGRWSPCCSAAVK